MQLAESLRIKTGPDSYTDSINFLSESVYFRDGDNLDTKLDKLQEKDQEIKDFIDDINDTIGNVVYTGASLTEAIQNNQSSISTITITTIPKLESDISEINDEISALKRNFDASEAKIDNLATGAVQDNTNRIGALETKVTTLENQNLGERITVLEEIDIESILERLAALEAIMLPPEQTE